MFRAIKFFPSPSYAVAFYPSIINFNKHKNSINDLSFYHLLSACFVCFCLQHSNVLCLDLFAPSPHTPSSATSIGDWRCLCQKRHKKYIKNNGRVGIQSWILSGFVFWIDKFQNDTINRWYNSSNNALLCILWLYFSSSFSAIGYRSSELCSSFSDAWINEEISYKLDLRSWDSLPLWLIVF